MSISARASNGVSTQTLPAQVQIPPTVSKTADTNKVMLLEAWTNQESAAGRDIPPEYRYHSVSIITACVKTPGVYQYSAGMTVADLVAAAGGLANNGRSTNNPALDVFPRCISVYRVTQPVYSVGNAFKCVFQFKLDGSADGGIRQADFELKAGDDVIVSMSPCLP